MSKMTYTEALEGVNRKLERLETDLSEVKVNVATLAEHVANQNGRVGKNEHSIDTIRTAINTQTEALQAELANARVAAAQAAGERRVIESKHQSSKDIRDRLIANWDKILYGVLLALMTAKLFA